MRNRGVIKASWPIKSNWADMPTGPTILLLESVKRASDTSLIQTVILDRKNENCFILMASN